MRADPSIHSSSWLTGGVQVGHMWRTTKDVSLEVAATWPDILENLDSTARLARFAGPGGWNDAGAASGVLQCDVSGLGL